MAAVANIHRNFSVNGFEYGMTVFALHVVPDGNGKTQWPQCKAANNMRLLRALVKITNSRDMVLAMFADYGASVAEHHGSVVTCVTMNNVSLVHGRHYDHVVLARLAGYERAASGG
jgi:hypothetical protein